MPTLRIRRDDRGRVVERSWLDARGEPRTGQHAFERTRYDEDDREAEVAFFDAAGRPAPADDGAVGHSLAYDDQDRPIEKRYFGADGNDTTTRGGVAIVRTTYTPDGAAHEERIGSDGQALVQFGARHLLVQYQGAMRASPAITRTREQARARAEEARKSILGGIRFEEAVGLYSDEPGAAKRGGDLGKFRKGMMVPPFERAVEALKVEQVSEVVETPFGFHVIQRTY
jgi:hypothetical protein